MKEYCIYIRQGNGKPYRLKKLEEREVSEWVKCTTDKYEHKNNKIIFIKDLVK